MIDGNVLFTEWLATQSRVSVLNYVHPQMERVIALPFTADDVAAWDVDDVRQRIRFAVRDGLGLHPMVDCFNFDVDGY